jgi:hypothetical protein
LQDAIKSSAAQNISKNKVEADFIFKVLGFN